MDIVPLDAWFCSEPGLTFNSSQCCRLHDASDSCTFFRDVPSFCDDGSCVRACQDVGRLYTAPLTSETTKSPDINLFTICLNLPSVIGYFRQGLLPLGAGEDGYAQSVHQSFPVNTTDAELQNVTSAVTHCLVSSCDQARDATTCSHACSPASLLINSTTPSVSGLSSCLSTLCRSVGGLPYANSDVLGIGVFLSYIAQCVITLLAWLWFVVLDSKTLARHPQQREIAIMGLVEFHKAQCFFSIALQIACISEGIFNFDLLKAVLFLPLSMNGILPVVFAFLLLTRYGRASVYLMGLTGASWFLATVVFWALSANAPLNKHGIDSALYVQIVTMLSANPACGGHSAQALCGHKGVNYNLLQIANAAVPIMLWIWCWCSLCFFVLVGHFALRKTIIWICFKIQASRRLTWFLEQSCYSKLIGKDLIAFGMRAFCITILTFLACFGFQFFASWTLFHHNLINAHNWTFGQVIGINIWLQPLIEYFYLQLRGVVEGTKYRLAKSVTVTRVSPTRTAQPAGTSTPGFSQLQPRSPAPQSSSQQSAPGVPIEGDVELSIPPLSAFLMDEGVSATAAVSIPTQRDGSPLPPRRAATSSLDGR